MLKAHPLRPASSVAALFTCLIAAQTAFAGVDDGSSNTAHDEPIAADLSRQSARESADTGASPRVLMCFGGLNDRKFVIPDEDLRNPDKQTTMRSCQLDGGLPSRGPQSPTRRPQRFLMG